LGNAWIQLTTKESSKHKTEPTETDLLCHYLLTAILFEYHKWREKWPWGLQEVN